MDWKQKVNQLKAAKDANIPDEVVEAPPPAASTVFASAPPQYLALRLHQFSLPSGKVVKPVQGVYTPVSEKEEEMLEYYLEQDQGLVSRL